ncbi:MAG: nucleotidyltransferase domain-containing protein [Bacteroidetes bacterium]|nr:MAG: nucleotidyltransferase domain-containing protein [Bacteroidota bacterium]
MTTIERKLQIYTWIKEETESLFCNQKYKLFIFGSQANRAFLSNSDIDIGVDAGRPIESQIISKLWNKLDDLPTLYSFDIIDFQTVEERFKKVALKNIEILKDGL